MVGQGSVRHGGGEVVRGDRLRDGPGVGAAEEGAGPPVPVRVFRYHLCFFIRCFS